MRLIERGLMLGILLAVVSVSSLQITSHRKIARLEKLETELEKKVERMLPREVTLTAYSSEVRQTNSDPNQTAFMVPVKRWSVAISRDLVLEGWTPGSWVYLFEMKEGKFKGIGSFQIRDLMHKRKKRQFDIWVPDKKFAIKLGRKKGVRAVLLKF